MGTYLREFSERVVDVPGYLRRHLALIRDLDERVVALQEEIEVHSKRRLAARGSPEGKRQKLLEQHPYDIDSAMTRLLSLADEKVNIAAQIYDFIDKHIQHLDDDLKSLGQDIEADKARLGLAPDDSACAQLGVELKQLRGQRKQGKAAGAEDAGQGAGNKEKGKRKGKKKDADDGEGAAVLAHPAGEHEPVYCQCQRPSHGNMVACDNDECPFEWFHYECVGLTEAPPPDQEWFCPGCDKIMKAKRAAGVLPKPR